MTDIGQETLEQLVRNASLAADSVAVEMRGLPAAQVTRAVIRRSLDVLLAHGMIAITDPDTWPDWVELDRKMVWAPE